MFTLCRAEKVHSLFLASAKESLLEVAKRRIMTELCFAETNTVRHMVIKKGLNEFQV